LPSPTLPMRNAYLRPDLLALALSVYAIFE